jgi:ATP-dependent Clp protease ATP-binding subunit ClpB
VRISDSALVDAAVLSSRYIADRFLPDKAIDLIDESAAKLKMEITSKPLALDEIDRKVGVSRTFGINFGWLRRMQTCIRSEA